MANKATLHSRRKFWRKQSFPITSMDLTLAQVQAIENWEKKNIHYEWVIVKVEYRRMINHPENVCVFWYCAKFIEKTSHLESRVFSIKLVGDDIAIDNSPVAKD